jgi:putative membrane protein
VLAAFAAVAGITAATLAVSAQTPPPYGPPPGTAGQPPPGGGPAMRMPASDADFVRALDRANTAELDMAKYVVNRTKDPAVQQFAQHMIDDHSTTAVKLEAATRGTNLRPAPRDDGTMPGMGLRGLLILQGESGSQMDNDFMRMQVPAHRRALGLLQWESQNGTNMGLKALATTLVPTVQQHLQLAQTYLAAHNLTPYTPPDVLPVPGNVNPNNNGAGPGPGTPNNPANPPSGGGSTGGQNNGTATPSPSPSGSPRPM